MLSRSTVVASAKDAQPVNVVPPAVEVVSSTSDTDEGLSFGVKLLLLGVAVWGVNKYVLNRNA